MFTFGAKAKPALPSSFKQLNTTNQLCSVDDAFHRVALQHWTLRPTNPSPRSIPLLNKPTHSARYQAILAEGLIGKGSVTL